MDPWCYKWTCSSTIHSQCTCNMFVTCVKLNAGGNLKLNDYPGNPVKVTPNLCRAIFKFCQIVFFSTRLRFIIFKITFPQKWTKTLKWAQVNSSLFSLGTYCHYLWRVWLKPKKLNWLQPTLGNFSLTCVWTGEENSNLNDRSLIVKTSRCWTSTSLIGFPFTRVWLQELRLISLICQEGKRLMSNSGLSVDFWVLS